MTIEPELKPPAGVGAVARRLWSSVVDEWVLDEHELALLRELVRVVDRLERLDRIVRRDGLTVLGPGGWTKIHPAAIEHRQLAIAQARLTAALRLPDGEAGAESQGRRQRRVGARGVYALRGVS